MLGFVIRQTLEIKDPICVKVLYFALVRSILESRTARIESIQKRIKSIHFQYITIPITMAVITTIRLLVTVHASWSANLITYTPGINGYFCREVIRRGHRLFLLARKADFLCSGRTSQVA